MARGEPGVPRRFSWRGRAYRVVEIRPGWKEMSAPEGSSGDRYVRRHATLVVTDDGSLLSLVAERGRGRQGLRWWVRRIREADSPSPAGYTVPAREGRGMKIQALKYILSAQDMDRAVQFWRDAIGLQVALHTPHWSELRWGDATVALHGGGRGEYHATGLGFQVEDIEAACAEVAAAGGTVRQAPVDRPQEGIRIADLADPEGNGFQISSRIA